jgi:hypothetical protein
VTREGHASKTEGFAINDGRSAVAALALCLIATGCAPHWVSVRLDEPKGAVVTVPPGVYGGAPVRVTAPFQATFQPTSRYVGAGYPIELDLDEATARRYGVDRAIRLYGRLNVTMPFRPYPGTLVIEPSEDLLHALISGQVAQIHVAAADEESPTSCGHESPSSCGHESPSCCGGHDAGACTHGACTHGACTHGGCAHGSCAHHGHGACVRKQFFLPHAAITLRRDPF